MPKKCEKCGKEFSNRTKIDGKIRNLQNRKYCLECSPWKKHNTKRIHVKINKNKISKRCSAYKNKISKMCSVCKIEKSLNEFYFNKIKDKHNSWCKECVYASQKKRWRHRKVQAVNLFDGKCVMCGYNKNYASLDFHHISPKEKDCDWNKLRLKSWDKVVKELKKCILVCKNCHGEIHWSDSYFDKDEKLNDNNFLNREINELKSTGKCPNCDCDVYETKYCCTKCAKIGIRKVRERPLKSVLMKMIEEMSWCAIGKKYGVSDNAVRKWARKYGII